MPAPGWRAVVRPADAPSACSRAAMSALCAGAAAQGRDPPWLSPGRGGRRRAQAGHRQGGPWGPGHAENLPGFPPGAATAVEDGGFVWGVSTCGEKREPLNAERSRDPRAKADLGGRGEGRPRSCW